MDRNSQKALAENLDKLMKHHGFSQERLAAKAGIGQRTVSNLLRPDAGKSPTMDSIGKVCSAFGIDTYQILIPDTPLDLLLNHSLNDLIDNYKKADSEGRDNTLRVAENEARYSTNRKAT